MIITFFNNFITVFYFVSHPPMSNNICSGGLLSIKPNNPPL